MSLWFVYHSLHRLALSTYGLSMAIQKVCVYSQYIKLTGLWAQVVAVVFLSSMRSQVQMMETLVSSVYMRLKTFTRVNVNDTRKKMFLAKGVSFDKLPPTKDVLYLKILRCVYQSMVWTNSLMKSPGLPSAQSFGWKLINGTLSFLWSTLPDIVKGCWDTFVKCNCKKSNCSKNCSCKNLGEPCTTLCGCHCYN